MLLLGAGGLGSPAALYLAAAGVGTLGIVDMDVVDASNLQRQILHNMDRIGERKVDSAKKTLTELNPDVDVVTYDVRLGADNVLDIIDGYDVIVDGTDNFPTRYLAERRVAAEAHPGRARLDLPVRGPGLGVQALRGPLLPLPPARAAAAGAGARAARRPACSACCPGIIGSIQALEAIKLILDLGDPLIGRLLAYDALEQSFRAFKVRRDPDVPGLRRARGADRDRRVRRAVPPARRARRRQRPHALISASAP